MFLIVIISLSVEISHCYETIIQVMRYSCASTALSYVVLLAFIEGSSAPEFCDLRSRH